MNLSRETRDVRTHGRFKSATVVRGRLHLPRGTAPRSPREGGPWLWAGRTKRSRASVTTMIKTIEAIEPIAVSADTLTTIPVRASTRAELQRLKSGGQSYDDVIRAILEELEEQDPWFQEMEQRLKDIHSGKAKLEPIESLYTKYPPSRARRSPR